MHPAMSYSRHLRSRAFGTGQGNTLCERSHKITTYSAVGLATGLFLALVAAGCDAVHRVPQAAGSALVVEVAVFEGGYGIDWHQKIAAKYNREIAPPDVRVELWGDPRVVEKIKPRILRGDPPDVFLAYGLPVWLLIGAQKLHPFDSALDRPAVGTDETWRELFLPGTLDTYTSDGHVYAIPSAFGAWTCWYNARLFREHGWEVPETWAEFDALCGQIHQAGIAPLAFQGKYPTYAWGTYISLIQRCGGLAAINRINQLEPDAFSHPACVQAAKLLQDMALDHFQKGAMAMTHTESQLQFVNDQAALIWCGVWLENEMKNSTPPDFEMRCFNMPPVQDGKGNPALVNGSGGEFLHIPADARYPEQALDFCRYLVSLENAPDMGASIGVISPLRGGTPREAVTPALESVLDILDQTPGIFNVRLTSLLLEWNNQVLQPNLTALLRGEITPGQLCRVLDEGMAAARNDPDITIPPYVPYDPAQFGEMP